MLKPVYIIWHDAVSNDAWEELKEAKDLHPHQIHTLGFLLDEDKNKVVVALNFDIEREGASQMLSIPRSWIVKIRKLRIKL
jgi:hypothetical protein